MDFSNTDIKVSVPPTKHQPSTPSSNQPSKMPSKTLLTIADEMCVELGFKPSYWGTTPPPKPDPFQPKLLTTVWRLGKLLHAIHPETFTVRDWNELMEQPTDTQPDWVFPSALAQTLSQSFFAKQTERVITVHRRDTPFLRPRGHCYANSYDEMEKSKNSQAFVLINIYGDRANGDGLVALCPHSINYDPTTNTFYDTTQIWKEGQTSYTAYLINDIVKPYYKGKHPLHTILTGGKTIDQTYGSFLSLYWKGVCYGFRAYDHNSEAVKDTGEFGLFRRYEFVEAVA